jgi:hypothetical protein
MAIKCGTLQTVFMRISLVLFAGILLSSCMQRVPGGITVLPPDIVLKNAASASALLESASYEMTVNFSVVGGMLNSVSGTADLDGSLYDSGKQIQFSTKLNAILADSSTVDLLADVISLAPEEVYVRLQSFSTTADSPAFSPVLIGAVQGKWLQFGSRSANSPIALSADPRVLQSQAQVVRVTQELPLSRIHGAIAYHYNVVVDPQKLANYLAEIAHERGDEFVESEVLKQYESLLAYGEIWIDAQTFTVQKLHWSLEPFATGTGLSISGSLDVRFFDFNEAEPISAPDNAFSPFQTVSSGSQSIQSLLKAYE